MFVGVSEVYAASDMTCVYNDKKKVYVVTQNSNGLHFEYFKYTSKDVDEIINYIQNIEAYEIQTDWTHLRFNEYNFDSGYGDANSGLSKCSPNLKVSNNTSVSFLDKNGKYTLIKSYDSDILNGINDFYDSDDYVNNSCDSLGLKDYWLSEPNSSSEQACLYAYSHSNYGCMLVQIDLGNDFRVLHHIEHPNLVNVENSITSEQLELFESGGKKICPPAVFALGEYKGNSVYHYIEFKIDKTGASNKTLYNLSLVHELVPSDYTNLIQDTNVKVEDCDDLLSSEMVDLLSSGINIVKILIPIILLVLGIVDFASSVFSGKEDNMKKNLEKFIKRVIICFVIFLVPSLLKLILTIASNIWPVIDPTLCNIL